MGLSTNPGPRQASREGGCSPILAHALRYKTVGFLTCRISGFPLRSMVSDHVFTRSRSFGVQSGVCHLPGGVYCSGTGVL